MRYWLEKLSCFTEENWWNSKVSMRDLNSTVPVGLRQARFVELYPVAAAYWLPSIPSLGMGIADGAE
jgi:hypothetical protein